MSSVDLWDRGAPTPVSDASTSTTNWREGSGKMRIGAVVKRCLRSLKAKSAWWFHLNEILDDVRVVSGAATML